MVPQTAGCSPLRPIHPFEGLTIALDRFFTIGCAGPPQAPGECGARVCSTGTGALRFGGARLSKCGSGGAAVAAVLLSLAACGGGSGDGVEGSAETSTAATTSKRGPSAGRGRTADEESARRHLEQNRRCRNGAVRRRRDVRDRPLESRQPLRRRVVPELTGRKLELKGQRARLLRRLDDAGGAHGRGRSPRRRAPAVLIDDACGETAGTLIRLSRISA